MWQELSRKLHGTLLRPGTARYTSAALPYNQRYAAIRPQGVAECLDADDVRQCIMWARDHKVPFAVRSGGHSYAGYSTTTGLLVSVVPMRAIRYDAAQHLVTIEAGVQNRHLFQTLPALDLAVPNGRCPTVGMGGFVLGGGFGFNSRRMGLASDNLVSTTLVTASGELVTCSEDVEPDLFWALRGGGGGNFGVNTTFTLRTQSIGPLAVYRLRWKWQDAPAVMAAAQSLMSGAPNALSARVGLDVGRPVRPGGPPSLSVSALGQFFGTKESLASLLAPLAEAAPPTEETVMTATYQEAVDFFAANVPIGRFTERSSYIGPGGITPALVEAAMASIEKWPGSDNVSAVGLTMFAWGGALSAPSPTETAFVHRDASWLAVIGTSWGQKESSAHIAENLAWLEDFDAAIQPHVTDEAYQNFADPSLKDWPTAYYGVNLPRLMAVKRQVDPENIFSFAQSIPPT